MQQVSKYPSTYYRVSLKAIIRNQDGEVLMVKENGQKNWSLPGGGWDHGETARQCLLRELYEEVGFEGDITIRPLAADTEPVFLEKKQAWLLWMVYEVLPSNMNFRVGDDADQIAFIDPHTLEYADSWAQRTAYRYLKEHDLLYNL